MSDSNKAVFLSYASQDAEAARRIADALRAAGVEVWFDQSELVGGDAWDQKIRTQIRECALLIPVISKTTQARREAYFRLEWKLADERTHLMAKGTPFLLPVTIDETNDRGALVPDSFLAVQWTKAPRGETPPAFGARVKKLLSGSDVVAHLEGTRESSVPDGRHHATPLRKSPRWLVPAIVAGVVIAAGAMWLTRTPAENPVQRKPDSNLPAVSASARTESEQLTARAYAMTQRLSFTPDDLAIAESLTERATTLEPDSGRAWSVRAWVQGSYLMRNWDRSSQRLQDTQTFAKRALALSPDDADALNALAVVMEKQGASSEAEKLSRRALAIDPSNYRSRALLARALERQDRKAEGRAVLQEAATLDPGNALVHYELANSYVPFGTSSVVPTEADVKAALGELDAALAVQPFSSALVAKAMLLGGRRGDIPGMLAVLDQLEQMPLTERTSERAIFVTLIGGLWAHDPARIHRAAALMSQDYFEDLVLASPKAWWEALAYRLEGKDVLAQMNWSLAETFLRKQITEKPGNLYFAPQLATTLAWLGKNEEAGRIIAPFEAAVQERESTWANAMLARYYAARGDATRTVTNLRSVLNSSIFITDYSLPLDPWWDKVRGQPEFEALLAEAKARIAGAREQSALSPAPVADAKSVAVLAFANLSDDKDNEYFSDGISEELLNVLAKIPGLKVTARTSAFFFKGKQVPIADIAQQLGVAYVVEGSVRKAGERVRISAQLIKASDGFNVWSDSFDRDLKDIFAVQDEIAGRIARELSSRLGVATSAVSGTGGTKSVEAYEAFLKGRAAWNQRTYSSNQEAVRYFQQAIALDPGYALAHGALAEAYVMLSISGIEPADKVFPLAKASADRALELDPNIVQAYTALAEYYFHYAGDYKESDRQIDRAIAVDPNYAVAYSRYSGHLICRNRLEEALAMDERSIALNPLGPEAANSWTLLCMRRYDEALESARRESAPDRFPMSGRETVGLIQFLTGHGEEAVKTLEAVVRDFPEEIDPLTYLGWVYGQAGQTAEAREILQRMMAIGESRYVSPLEMAKVAAGMNDSEQAFAQLERAFERREPELPTIGASRFFDPIRDDPRFREMLKRLKLDVFFPETPKK